MISGRVQVSGWKPTHFKPLEVIFSKLCRCKTTLKVDGATQLPICLCFYHGPLSFSNLLGMASHLDSPQWKKPPKKISRVSMDGNDLESTGLKFEDWRLHISKNCCTSSVCFLTKTSFILWTINGNWQHLPGQKFWVETLHQPAHPFKAWAPLPFLQAGRPLGIQGPTTFARAHLCQ